MAAIVVAAVRGLAANAQARPLLYYRGRYAVLAADGEPAGAQG